MTEKKDNLVDLFSAKNDSTRDEKMGSLLDQLDGLIGRDTPAQRDAKNKAIQTRMENRRKL